MAAQARPTTVGYTNDGPDKEPDHAAGRRYHAYDHAFTRQALKDGHLMRYTKKHMRGVLKQIVPEGVRCRITRRYSFANAVGIIRVEWPQ